MDTSNMTAPRSMVYTTMYSDEKDIRLAVMQAREMLEKDLEKYDGTVMSGAYFIDKITTVKRQADVFRVWFMRY